MSRLNKEHPELYIKELDDYPLSGRMSAMLMSAVLERNLPFRFRARGKSMFPIIKDRDVITVLPISSSSQTGDIVAFVSPKTEKLAVHRIVAKTQEKFFICGDNFSSKFDGVISQIHILGQVVQIERNGKPIQFGLGTEKYLIAMLSWIRIFPFMVRRLFFKR